jgi:hypothetical protein
VELQRVRWASAVDVAFPECLRILGGATLESLGSFAVGEKSPVSLIRFM